MSVTYGFYNSLNGDRTYTAEEFSSFLDGIVYDGVYGSVGDCFYVRANGSEWQVIVGTGRAWLDHTWTLNDSNLYLDIPTPSDTLLDRIDAVVIEVNKENRENYIKVITGTASQNPVRPKMTKDENVKQYPLAYITIPAASITILQENIKYVVEKNEDAADNDYTPLCSSLALEGLPSGGKVGQVLAKSSSESGAVGWYNVDQLPTEDWMHPSGVVDDDIIAAYRFKGADSEAAALRNINNSSTPYVLTKSGSNVTWSAAGGFFIPAVDAAGLRNTTLQAKTFGTIAVKFANAATGDKSICLCAKSAARAMMLRVHNHVHYETASTGTSAHGVRSNGYPGYFYTNYYQTTALGTGVTDGVMSANFTAPRALYHNEAKLSIAIPNVDITNGNHFTTPNVFGQLDDEDDTNSYFGSYYIHAAIIFNRVLSDSEVARLHQLMLEL